MTTATKSLPEHDLEPHTEDFDPIINHYVHNADITESIVTGRKVTALCGETYVVHAQGNGSTAATGRESVICPFCADIYEGMRPSPAE